MGHLKLNIDGVAHGNPRPVGDILQDHMGSIFFTFFYYYDV